MADWNENAPLDNSVISQFPANERAARAALVTNFGVDHHETNDSQVGFHEQVTLIERADHPSAVADLGHVYAKDVNGLTELYYKGSNNLQMTVGDRVKGQQKPVLKTSNYTAVAGDNILVDKSGGNVTITLPASPSIGDEPITITHIAGTSNTLTVGRNGNAIMALAEDMTIDANYPSICLYWGGTTPGWRLGVVG
jgi:hypothetical protein